MKIDVEQVKARHSLSAVIGRRVKLRKAGHEHVGLCPFHQENTPSFRVNDTKGLFHCFGCGASGDVIDFIRAIDGLDFRGAVEFLANGDLPAADPIDRVKAERIERAERIEATKEAFRQWASARSITGTPAEIYLRSRGITGPVPWSVRFTYAPIRIDKETGKPGPRLPALIAACQDVRGKIVGVQRIFLDREGRKARMTNPKLSLGQTRGCALRLGDVARRIVLCEGPEDGLTLRQRHPDASVWVSLGTGGLAHVELPPEVEEVILAGDNNAPGRAAIEAAELAYTEQGRKVRPVFPDPRFEDWNDELQQKVKCR
jgi:DNA primase